MELQISCSIRAEVQAKSILFRKEGSDKGNHQTIVPVEISRNNIGENMSGSHTFVTEHTAENECIGIHGISKGKKQFDDISEIWQHEICI